MTNGTSATCIVEVWCWPKLILDRNVKDNGHVEVKADRFYTFLPDKEKTILANKNRRIRRDDAFFGGYAGLLRIVDQPELISSYDDIYRREIDHFVSAGEKLEITVFVGQCEVNKEKYNNLIQHFENLKGKRKNIDGFFTEIEYFYRSEGESRNCATFCLEALKKVGIFSNSDELPGDGYWPDNFIQLLKKKNNKNELALRTGMFSPTQFVLEKE